jgi:hypothetical protein
LSTEEYKKKFGEVVDEEYKKHLSIKQKANWRQESYRNNITMKMKNKWATKDFYEEMCHKRKKYYNTKEWKEKCRIWFDKYHSEIGSWNKGLTKEDDIRIEKTGEANSKRLKGIKNPQQSLKMKKAWKNLKEKSPELYFEHNKKRSETMSTLISSGKIKVSSKHYKHGYYKSFYYASSYELRAMELFDKHNLVWTNKHKIRIPYLDDKSISRIYIPDFLVYINSEEYIIEMKGQFFKRSKKNALKKEAAECKYNERYKIFYSISDLEKFLKSTDKK